MMMLMLVTKMTMLMMMMMTMLMTMVTWKPVAEVISGQRPWIAVRMEADTSKEGRTCVEEVIFLITILMIIINIMIIIRIIIISRMCRKTNMVEAVLGGSQREEGGRVALHN